MATSVITVKARITKRGQQCYFQVNVPRDVVAIVGVEAGITGLQGLLPSDIVGRQLCGQLRIQAENAANMCYSSPVFVGMSAVDKKIPGFRPLHTAWQQTPYVGIVSNDPDPVLIKGSYMLYGSFADVLGKRLGRDLTYTAGVYLWTETGEK